MVEKYVRCSNCVLSASFPGIAFDEQGVCNFCNDKTFFSTEAGVIEKAKIRIRELFEEKKSQSEYDAILCFSGGKDSTLALMLAVEHYHLKVLAFTLDNGFVSPTAVQNIRSVVDRLGVDLVTIRPSSVFFKKLVKASALCNIYNPKTLLRISSVCNSCISVVNNTALKIAIEKDIPFIITGFTLGQIPLNAIIYKNNYKFLQESREPYLEKLRKEVGKTVDHYLCIPESILDKVKCYPQTVNILCIENLNETEMIKKIEPCGWNNPGDVDGCSTNCRLNTFNNYVHSRIYQYSPYELELSRLIRKKQLSRKEALYKISQQPEGELKAVMAELGITRKEIDQRISVP